MMMLVDLKQAGTSHVSSEVLKMFVNTGDSWSAQCFSVEGETECVVRKVGKSTRVVSLMFRIPSLVKAIWELLQNIDLTNKTRRNSVHHNTVCGAILKLA